MTEEMLIFDKVAKIVRQQENHVPREYKTVGGMWTVDTYKKNDVTLQLMDEGWTTKIFNEHFSAIDAGGHFIIEKGNLEELKNILESIS
jgi:hypothetical protein